MWRVAIFFGCCLAMLITATIGEAQGTLADYFAELEKASSEGAVGKDLEQRRLNEAILNLQQGKFREAIRECTRVLERFVNHPKGMAILGMAAKLGKEPALPISYYERALQMYPHRALTQAQYGKYLAEIGKIEDGIAHLKRALEVDPKLTPAYVWLARIYVQNRQSDLARQILQRKKEVEAMAGIVSPEVLEARQEPQGREEGARGAFSEDPNMGSNVFGEKERKEGDFPSEKTQEAR
jgi:tetratricopeptide (TPR) repeat protein